jgi:glycosidase
MKKIALCLFLFCSACFALRAANDFTINRIDPPNWWVGMKDTTLQLCVFGKNISSAQIGITQPGITVQNISKVENPDYLFIDLSISPDTRPGDVMINFSNGDTRILYNYYLAKRSTTPKGQGFDDRDFIYQIMPDRFANGDTKNDIVPDMREKTINRDSMFYRHGGDLQGIIDHFDYIKQLGATGIWLTPIQQNDEKRASYHGYSFTDHYQVDARYGDNEFYRQFVSKAHQQGLKVIMDMVYNHTGSQHWMIQNLPMKDWIHQSDTFFQTNYRVTALMDPHASDYDKHKMTDGWFVKSMPDLNQQNPFVARYLIQNSIWWVETMGIDGFRIDTYAYSDLGFMSNLMAALHNEYPNFRAVAELWDHEVSFQAYMQHNSKIVGAPETHLDGLIDFQFCFAVSEALNKPMNWTDGLTKVYYTLAQDFLYSEPDRNLIFVDNHDLSRFYSVIGENLQKFKMGMGFLFTMRGIPALYYGTEILMKNFADPDGKVRSDFPGGWPGDKVNKFKADGRTKQENEAFDFIQKLAMYRKEHPVLQTGELTQFVPENDTYVYFRSNSQSTVMVVMHYGEKAQELSLGKFSEKLNGFTKGKEIEKNETVSLNKPLYLEPYSVNIIELEK